MFPDIILFFPENQLKDFCNKSRDNPEQQKNAQKSGTHKKDFYSVTHI
jgi:hypothetical protein